MVPTRTKGDSSETVYIRKLGSDTVLFTLPYSLNGNDGKELSLLRVNGVGFSFYGKYRELLIGDYRTYVTYHVFCFFFIPILPLGCCRVIRENGGYRILGGERMVWREILCMFLGLIKWPVAVVAFLRLLVLFLK